MHNLINLYFLHPHSHKVKYKEQEPEVLEENQNQKTHQTIEFKK